MKLNKHHRKDTIIFAAGKKNRKRKNGISYPLKLNKQTTEKIHCSTFLMVEVALIYVVMWRNKWSTKSQTFWLLVITNR